MIEKIGQNNRKDGKANQMFAPRPEHDKIQTRWAIDILLKNMLEKV
jgi:hypothetical protein